MLISRFWRRTPICVIIKKKGRNCQNLRSVAETKCQTSSSLNGYKLLGSIVDFKCGWTRLQKVVGINKQPDMQNVKSKWILMTNQTESFYESVWRRVAPRKVQRALEAQTCRNVKGRGDDNTRNVRQSVFCCLKVST